MPAKYLPGRGPCSEVEEAVQNQPGAGDLPYGLKGGGLDLACSAPLASSPLPTAGTPFSLPLGKASKVECEAGSCVWEELTCESVSLGAENGLFYNVTRGELSFSGLPGPMGKGDCFMPPFRVSACTNTVTSLEGD